MRGKKILFSFQEIYFRNHLVTFYVNKLCLFFPFVTFMSVYLSDNYTYALSKYTKEFIFRP